MLRTLRRDIAAVRERDPAATSLAEVLLCYPGLHALILHRIAHWIYKRLRLRLLPRLISTFSRMVTGIDIHPGAEIGQGFFIDHGMGVVIGETSEIGDNVTLYQGATLGGTGKERGKRHPTVEDDVVIGAGAKVLGNVIIGRGARIGAGSVVVHHVCPDATVVGVPGRIVSHAGERVMGSVLDHANLPDPILERLQALHDEIRRTEESLLRGSEFLEDILKCKRRELAIARSQEPLAELRARAGTVGPARSFAGAISRPGLQLIAEVKKASPSAGVIRANFDPAAIARLYEKAGAAAISCITDHCHFMGSLEHLSQVRGAAGLPVLRKDFLLEEYNVLEARAAGADAVLLIAAILDGDRLKEMLRTAAAAGMDALVEVHDERELSRALGAGAKIIGVNNRDLKTLEVDATRALALRPKIPAGIVTVAESGIKTRGQVKALELAGFHAVLIGETLLAADDVPAKIRELMGK